MACMDQNKHTDEWGEANALNAMAIARAASDLKSKPDFNRSTPDGRLYR